MRALACSEIADMVDELALDILPGDRRAAALDHLAGCASCRLEVEQLAAAADALILACPAVEPPPGFGEQVAAAMLRSQRRQRSRLVVWAAAAAAVLALFGGGTAISRPGTHRVNEAVALEGHELHTVNLIGADGRQIGDASLYTGSPAWFLMRVTRGQATATYRCVVDLDGGISVALGDMFVSHGRGAWGQQIDINGRQVRAVRVINADGTTVATAVFG